MLKDGLIHLIDEVEFDALLAEMRPLRIKAGFDPTSPDLHLGHVVLLKKLREFQVLGHTVVFIIGDATAAIGDPTGRNSLRPKLTSEQIRENADTYFRQANRILLKERTVIRYNSEWLHQLGLISTINLLSSFTVAQMLQRDHFKKRFESDQAIFLHELLYPLLQGYDSVWEKPDIELGGTDQLFNLLVGRDMMQMRGEKPQVVATVPLLEGLDGLYKMSKSLGNHIALTDSAFDVFSKVMSISDELMVRWEFILFPAPELLPHDAFTENQSNMKRKKVLAWRVTNLIHNIPALPETWKLADSAKKEWERVFSQRLKPMYIPEVRIAVETRLDRVLVKAGLSPSIRESGRLIKAGAVEMNGKTVSDPTLKVMCDSVDFRVGRKWMRVVQEKML